MGHVGVPRSPGVGLHFPARPAAVGAAGASGRGSQLLCCPPRRRGAQPGCGERPPRQARSGLLVQRLSQHERGDGSQRGESQHPRHEQPGHLALLRAGDWPPACGAPQHSLLQRPRGLDSHQHHPQHEHVHLPAHGERDALRDAGPGEGPAAHALGADGLRGTVHSIAQVPDHHTHRAVFPHQLLHEIRPDTLHNQHHLPDERPDPQAAPAPRSPDLRDQQILSPLVGVSCRGRGNPVVLVFPFPAPGM